MPAKPHDTPPAIEVTASAEQPLGMAPRTFLRDYWQKHPLLIRGAFPGFTLPLEPEDLAGLACEEAALARIVRRDRKANAWELRNGPFEESDFTSLPEQDWSVLVQDVDKWDADVAALLEGFRFVPDWRVDDVMVSYAAPGGGVGAHVDQYDVFLLQGMGTRHWAIDTQVDPTRAHRADSELKLLRDFTPSHAWDVHAGDMLYLPPGVAHDGTARDACMTFSVGMRAPGIAEMLVDCADYQALRMPDSVRYDDPDLSPADGDPGLIDARTLDRVHQLLAPLSSAMSHDALGLWFGAFITRYRCAQVPAPPEQDVSPGQLHAALQGGAMLLRNPWSRLAWMRRGQGAILFASGDSLSCPADLARDLCRHRYVQLDELPNAPATDVLCQLINEGHLQLSAQGVHADA